MAKRLPYKALRAPRNLGCACSAPAPMLGGLGDGAVTRRYRDSLPPTWRPQRLPLPPRLPHEIDSERTLPYEASTQPDATMPRFRRHESASTARPRGRGTRRLKHGSTAWCVFIGKRKKSCHSNKFSADAAAKSLRASHYRGRKIRIRKLKMKVRCPFGGRRVCRVRKGHQCIRYGCAGMKRKGK